MISESCIKIMCFLCLFMSFFISHLLEFTKILSGPDWSGITLVTTDGQFSLCYDVSVCSQHTFFVETSIKNVQTVITELQIIMTHMG